MPSKNRERRSATKRAWRARNGTPGECEFVGCDELKLPGRGQKYCVAHRALTKRERYKLVHGQAPPTYRKRRRAPGETATSGPAPAVPSDVRTLWREAHPNSILHKKYPTIKALEKNWPKDHPDA